MKKVTIYDILKSITYEKDENLIHDPDFKVIYNQYAINYFLMAHPTTVHLAMFASSQKMTNSQHYLFLLHALEKEYIYFKREYKNHKVDEYEQEVKAISEYFEINIEKSRDIHKLLKRKQVTNIYNLYNQNEVLRGTKIERI